MKNARIPDDIHAEIIGLSEKTGVTFGEALRRRLSGESGDVDIPRIERQVDLLFQSLDAIQESLAMIVDSLKTPPVDSGEGVPNMDNLRIQEEDEFVPRPNNYDEAPF